MPTKTKQARNFKDLKGLKCHYTFRIRAEKWARSDRARLLCKGMEVGLDYGVGEINVASAPCEFATWKCWKVHLSQCRISIDGYLLDSGSPYRLWFRFRLGVGVKNALKGYGLDGDGLLHETEEEFAAAF